MQPLTWDESVAIGVPEIDAQHRGIFMMLGEAAQAFESQAGAERARDLLKRLCDYVVDHFTAEEALMDPDAYPEYDLHMAQHMECSHKILELLQECKSGQDVDLEHVVEFLSGWIRMHVMEVDTTLGAHLRKTGRTA